MSGWKYRARTLSGEVRMGVVQAASLDEANRALVRSKLIPDSVEPAPKDQHFRLRRRTDPEALAVLARQFATLIDAAVPLIESLETLQELTEDRSLRQSLEAVNVDVQAGLTLADAMRRHPKAFTDSFVNMVEAGEEGGVLDEALLRIANYLERSQAMAARIKSALIYPLIILGVAIVSAAVMITFVVPIFEEMFATGGFSLPAPTRILVGLSEFFQDYWIWLLVGTLLLILFMQQTYDTEAGKRVFHALLLRVPVLGDLVRKAAVGRFTQSMASLLSSGVSLIDALHASARTCGNKVIEAAVLRAQAPIEGGKAVHEALSEIAVLPPLVSRMVRVGEKSGRLDEMFQKVAHFYEGELDTAVDRLMKAMEPALIVIVGVMLSGMVVALYLPIFEALTTVAA